MSQYAQYMQTISHYYCYQYLCSNCSCILKHSTEYIEIHHFLFLLQSDEGECPNCGCMIAKSLIARRVLLRSETKTISSDSPITQPKIQTADTLLQLKKLRFGIPKIDSLIELAATDLCCISGYGANLLLTRLCVRSLLPQRHGGLDSPYVIVADTGNQTELGNQETFLSQRQYGCA